MRPIVAPKKYPIFNNIHRKTADLDTMFQSKSINFIELRRI